MKRLIIFSAKRIWPSQTTTAAAVLSASLVVTALFAIFMDTRQVLAAELTHDLTSKTRQDNSDLGGTVRQDSIAEYRSPAFATSPEVLRAQIMADVTSAIDKNRSAQNNADYETSGYSSHDVFSNVKALGNPAAWSALCTSLMTLAPEPLAIFDLDISGEDAEKNLPCATMLMTRLAAYWKDNQSQFEQHLAGLTTRKAGPKTGQKFTVSLVERIVKKGTLTIDKNDLKDGEIAITFDGGPHPTRSLRILEILNNAGARANFFHVGKIIRKYDQIEHRLADGGAVIGTSGLLHQSMLRMPLGKAEKDLCDGRNAAEAATGQDTPFFRFPYGISTSELQTIAAQKKMTAFSSSIDSQDWKVRDLSNLYDGIISEIEKNKGGILLLHDLNEQSVLILPALLEEIKARGLTLVVFIPEQD